MIITVIPITIGGVMLARPIMSSIYGNRYNNGIIAFQLLIWAVTIISLNSVYAWGLLGCDKQSKCVKIVALQTTINVGLNFILIPYLGIAGAALATVVAEFSGLFFYFRAFKKIVCIRIHRQLLKPLAACLPMALFLHFGPQLYNLNVFFMILIGGLIYLLLSLLLRGITPEDYMILRKLKGSS